jgi:hypothetical protein
MAVRRCYSVLALSEPGPFSGKTIAARRVGRVSLDIFVQAFHPAVGRKQFVSFYRPRPAACFRCNQYQTILRFSVLPKLDTDLLTLVTRF